MKIIPTMKNSTLIILLLLAVSLTLFGQAMAQTEGSGAKNLKEQFQDMLDKSETYTEYKVIKRSKLSEYTRAVQDTLAQYRKVISTLRGEVADQKSQIAQLTKRIEDLEAQLARSEELRESLNFMGVEMYKTTYHLFVWLVIGGLAVFGVFAYTSFLRSNRVTNKVKKEMKELELEFEEHKKRNYEKQIKLGRELQTERNRVEELRAKLKGKSTGDL